jgi:hypothetical protein
MVSLSDNSTPSTLEPPPASDSRLAQPGSPYKASGRLGVWWIATLPGVVAGACAGLVAGSLAGERFFAVTRVGATPKAIIVVLLILIGVVAIITGVCTRVGRVRSAWFTFLMGLSGGVTFAALGLCAFAARGVGIGGANGGFSAVISKAWAYFSDWSAFDAALTTAVPNATTRVIILVVAGIAAGAVGGATVFIHGLITEGNLYDEATGGWYQSPDIIAQLDSASRPRERWKLQQWTPIVHESHLASYKEWTVLRLHPPRHAGVRSMLASDDDPARFPADESRASSTDLQESFRQNPGLPLVSLERAKAKDSKAFSWRRFRRVAKRDVETESDGTAFFVDREELEGLLARMARDRWNDAPEP